MMDNFARKTVKCGKCNKPKLLIYDDRVGKIHFICKCGAVNEYVIGTETTGKVITIGDL